jgi:uncharacterized Zn finger protein (UPF0148 family)
MKKPTIIEVDEGVITCPTCGKTIVEEDGPVSQPSCDHVRFIYVNGDAFEYIDPDLQKELNAEEAAAEERDEEFDTWDALRAHTGPDSIILEQTQRGMLDLCRLLPGSAFASRQLFPGGVKIQSSRENLGDLKGRGR